jgi:hypothetical protein
MIVVVFAVVLTGCNLAQSGNVEVQPTATSVRMPQTTLVPTLQRVFQPVAKGVATRAVDAVAASTASSACPLPDDANAPSAVHTVDAVLDYPTQTIQARQITVYTNLTGETLTDFVMNIEPNRWLEVFTLQGVLQKTRGRGSIQPGFDFTGRRLYLELVEPLAPNCTLEVELLFEIVVPPVRTGVDAFKGFFGHTDRQINLGHWLPSAAERIGDEWITRQAMFVGEQEVVGRADWDVTLKIENAPETLVIAAPGRVQQLGANHARYLLDGARDFTVSLGDGLNVQQATAENGVTVELYTFDDATIYTASGVVDSGNHALNVALRAFESFVKLFGDYPYDRLLVVQGDFPDGMEFSGIVFVSTTWFKGYADNPADFLTLITAHEISHQWWYARVGSDPALTPWLDEALSTYSEYIFIEQFYPHLKDWWWQFRVESHTPEGFVDSTIYEFSSIRAYINAVYLRGVTMLHALRSDLGTEVFFDLLRRYADTFDGKVASSADFWALLTPEQLERTRRTREVFLRRPDLAQADSGG